ncbi:hypothetical protein ACOJR9_11340 [Alteromonas sp. A081]|uniref:hypothetical protein n=1 Tax=Alteromonas sp. A081 TaxID=3410269 RepID=UPI003B9870C4
MESKLVARPQTTVKREDKYAFAKHNIQNFMVVEASVRRLHVALRTYYQAIYFVQK